MCRNYCWTAIQKKERKGRGEGGIKGRRRNAGRPTGLRLLAEGNWGRKRWLGAQRWDWMRPVQSALPAVSCTALRGLPCLLELQAFPKAQCSDQMQ